MPRAKAPSTELLRRTIRAPKHLPAIWHQPTCPIQPPFSPPAAPPPRGAKAPAPGRKSPTPVRRKPADAPRAVPWSPEHIESASFGIVWARLLRVPVRALKAGRGTKRTATWGPMGLFVRHAHLKSNLRVQGNKPTWLQPIQLANRRKAASRVEATNVSFPGRRDAFRGGNVLSFPATPTSANIAVLK